MKSLGNRWDIPKILKSEYWLLLPIMALAFYVAFIPHLSYSYPVHIDEWSHLAYTNQIVKQGTVSGLTDPYTGGSPTHNQVYEVGLHLPLAVFYQISGIPPIDVFRYFPSAVFVLTVLSAYLLGKRQGFGWEAALFVSLIPTMVGILGPAFVVPSALGLLFIPLSIFLAFNFRTIWSYVTLLLFTAFLIVLHGPIAVILVILLVPYIVVNFRSDPRHSVALAGAVAIPFVASLPWTWSKVVTQATALLSAQALKTYVDYPALVNVFGYPIIGLCLLGAFLLAMRGGKNSYGLVLGLLFLLSIEAIFYGLHYGVALLYERGLTPMMLMASIVAGAGLMGVRRVEVPARIWERLRIPLPGIRASGYILFAGLIGITLAVSIPSRLNTPYYHMIDSEDYRAFAWIGDNVGSSYEKAILDPWKASAFTAVTGKQVYSRIVEFPSDTDKKAYHFLQGGCKDTNFLRANGISIVYTPWPVQNPDLTEVNKNVYLLRQAP